MGAHAAALEQRRGNAAAHQDIPVAMPVAHGDHAAAHAAAVARCNAANHQAIPVAMPVPQGAPLNAHIPMATPIVAAPIPVATHIGNSPLNFLGFSPGGLLNNLIPPPGGGYDARTGAQHGQPGMRTDSGL